MWFKNTLPSGWASKYKLHNTKYLFPIDDIKAEKDKLTL